jgi:hypothetical protein
MKYEEKDLRLDQIELDQENPRFPTVANQREAIQSMLEDKKGGIVNLAEDIYENGLNPSTKLIVFAKGTKYIDGDGNRRLTAIKILETPSLCDQFPVIKRKISEILKKSGSVPNTIACVVFANREAARYWIAINHEGQQEGRGQITWSSEQKDRFEKKPSIGLEALDLLVHKKLITNDDKDRINKSTLDRLLSYKYAKSRLSIQNRGEHFIFKDTASLQKVVLNLRGTKVDVVYTSEKGTAFIARTLNPTSSENIESNRTITASTDNNEGLKGNGSTRSRRIERPGLPLFGGPLPLKLGHVNNLYRDIESVYNYYLDNKSQLSGDFIVICRMAIRLLAETAAKEINSSLQDLLLNNFDAAKSGLSKDIKTTLSSQSVEKGKIVQLFQTGAHDYANSKNEEQAIAMSIILGEILKITHGK